MFYRKFSLVLIQSLLLVLISQNSSAAEYALSEPYKHENLTLYFLDLKQNSQSGSPSNKSSKKIVPLDDALSTNKIVVHETGNVNELKVENTSADEVIFLQAGDIVKGGKQDRVLTTDMLLQPQSGQVAIGAFCVEQGRWRSRESESVSQFSSSKNRLSSKELKIAAFSRKEQSEVWQEVDDIQKKLQTNIGADVKDGRSATSLQLSLESDQLKGKVDDYLNVLAAKLDTHQSANGYVAIINGKISSADTFASPSLFQKQWPKLVLSTATEALAEFNEASSNNENQSDLPSTESILSFLNESEIGAKKQFINKKAGSLMLNDTENYFFAESRLNETNDSWVHKTYIKK